MIVASWKFSHKYPLMYKKYYISSISHRFLLLSHSIFVFGPNFTGPFLSCAFFVARFNWFISCDVRRVYSVNPADAPRITAAMVYCRGVIVLGWLFSSVVASLGVALVNVMVVMSIGLWENCSGEWKHEFVITQRSTTAFGTRWFQSQRKGILQAWHVISKFYCQSTKPRWELFDLLFLVRHHTSMVAGVFRFSTSNHPSTKKNGGKSKSST